MNGNFRLHPDKPIAGYAVVFAFSDDKKSVAHFQVEFDADGLIECDEASELSIIAKLRDAAHEAKRLADEGKGRTLPTGSGQ